MISSTISLQKDYLDNKIFSFGFRGREAFTNRFILEDSGRVGGYYHQHEHSWAYDENGLTIFTNEGEKFWLFDSGSFNDGAWTLNGRRPDDPTNTYYVELIEQLPPPFRPGWTAVETPMVAESKVSVAVLVRSHKCDEKFHDLIKKLKINASGFDLYAVVNETQGRPHVDSVPVVWHSLQACRDIGLTQYHASFFNWLGELPFYFALRELPSYNHYIVIEDDVDLVRGDATFVSALSEKLAADPGIDQVFLSMGPQQSFQAQRYKPLEKNFPSRFRLVDYFPFLCLSKRAAAYLFQARLIEAAKNTMTEDLMYCECFVSSALQSGGFRGAYLNDLIPGSYDFHWLGLQMGEEGCGVPMSARLDPPRGVEIVHAVYTDAEYVRRARHKYLVNNNGDWDGLAREFLKEHAKLVPAELKEAALVRSS